MLYLFFNRIYNFTKENSELGVPCIVSTDGVLKMQKYEHLGFNHYQDRKFKERVYEHDLIRYPKSRQSNK